MAKPSITNITTTQTFQNWFDKTNEQVDLWRNSALTASVAGDSVTGDSILLGEFTANTLIGYDKVETDLITSRVTGNNVHITSPIEVISSASNICATFQFNSTGARTRYTDGASAWDVGYENATDDRFIITTGGGTPQFALSTDGTLEIETLKITNSIETSGVGGDINVANVTSTDTLTANTANVTKLTCLDINGNFTGDIYHPNADFPGLDNSNKIFENGGPTNNNLPTFKGNVQGTVSSLLNHNTDALAEGSTNLYFTTARARASLSAGTGVTYNNGTGVISIGQAVGTGSNVTFNNINASGNILAEGNITAFGSISDATMKENINPITNALDKISQLGGYTFNYKGDETPMTGVIAQELKDVLPGIVYETTDPRTKETCYAVRHGNIIGLLIEAIKELKEQIGKK